MAVKIEANLEYMATYLTVINPSFFHYILSAANHYDLDLIQLDVKNVFLYADIDYKVHVEVPAGVA